MPKQRDDQEPKRRSHSPRGSDSDRHRRNRDDTSTLAPMQSPLSNNSIPSIRDHERLQEAGSSFQPHGHSERNRQGVLQQEAQQQQFRSPYESHEAAQQFSSERAAPPRHETSVHDTPTIPTVTGKTLGLYTPRTVEGTDISDEDKKTCLTMKRDNPQCRYETISKAIGYRHTAPDIERFCEQHRKMEASAKKFRESQEKTMKP